MSEEKETKEEKLARIQAKRKEIEELCKRLGILYKNTTKEHLGELVIIPMGSIKIDKPE